MRAHNTQASYGWMMMSLHWLLTVLLITLFYVGLYMVSLPLGAQKFQIYGLHKEFGVIVLFLVSFRFLWRLLNIQPELPKEMPRTEVYAALFMHYLLYFLMFAIPISGWIMSSAAGFSVSFFGLFVLPDWVSANENLRKAMGQTHEWLAYALMTLVILHTLAALKHHFINKDDVLRKMLP